jgi:general nucleoside transport system permease protein
VSSWAVPGRWHVEHFRSALLPSAALVAALLVGLGLIAATGVPLDRSLSAFWEGIAGSPYAVVGSLTRAVPLALVGLGYLIAERGNLTNVGGEGQIAVGGIASAAGALKLGGSALPGPLAVLWPLLLGTAAGAAWGALVGVLKAKRGASEVIVSLLLCFVGLELVYGVVQSEALLRQPVTSSSTLPESLPIPTNTELPLLLPGTGLPLHIGGPMALLFAVGVALLLGRSRFGLELGAVGQNPLAARRAGLNVAALVVSSLALSGAFGGLAGAIMLQGDQHYLTAGFSSGYGFDGLVVGLLGRGSAASVLAFALLLGCLRSGGMSMEMSAQVPSAVVVICQGLIIVSVAAAARFARAH